MCKKLIAVILSLLLTAQASALECKQPVTLLDEGAPAPCRGYLFTPEKELEVRILKQESKIDKQEIDSLNKINERLTEKDKQNEAILEKKDEQLDLWKVRAEESTLKVVEQQDGQRTRDMLHIGLGVVLTVLAGWAIGQAGK